MSEPINLNRVRKDRAKAARRKQADENVVKFGRTKAKKSEEQAEEERRKIHLDAHRLDDDET